TRNTLDISAVPVLKQETHLPVLVDVTHSTGRRDLLIPTAKAALAIGADGVMAEVHPDPAVALSDSQQHMNFEAFDIFYIEVNNYRMKYKYILIIQQAMSKVCCKFFVICRKLGYTENDKYTCTEVCVMSITIYDVAREANVSMATVSRVVNGNPNVKPTTRKKVLRTNEEIGYRTNAVARGLASKKATTVGAI